MKKASMLLAVAILLLVQNGFSHEYEGNWPDGRFGSGQGNGGTWYNDSRFSNQQRPLSPREAELARRDEIRRSHYRANNAANFKEFSALAEKYQRVHGADQWRLYGQYKTLDELREHLAGYPAALYPDPKLTQYGAPPYSYVTSEENTKRLAEINANRGEYESLRQRYLRWGGQERWAKIGGYMTLGELRNAAKYFSVAAVVGGAIGVGVSSEAQAASVRYDPNSGEMAGPVSIDKSNVGTRNPVLSQSEGQNKGTNRVGTSR